MNKVLIAMRHRLLTATRRALTAMCMVLGAAAVYAAGPDKDITGTIVDADGEPVIGATVRILGTNRAVATNADGKYYLKASEGEVVEATYIGCHPEQATVGRSNVVDFLLRTEAGVLDEVVVVGYGTVKKKDLTGAVSNLKGERVAERHQTQLATALQGAIAGVQVSRSNGQPGAGASEILIRGVTTIGDTSPLIIVDGIPVDNINDVNANDVESISVLKDAASAAIYGSRAASGVVLITTKRAKENDTQVSYTFEYGLEMPTSTPKQVGFQRYMEMVNELKYNDNPTSGWFQEYSEDDVANWVANSATDPDNYPITDWYDLMVKGSAPRQSHVVNLAGGTKKIRTRATFSYDRQEGLFREATNTYDRYMARINNDLTFSKYLSAEIDLNVKYTETEKPEFTSVWTAIFNYSPAYAPVWANGGMGDVKGGSNPYGRLVKGGNIKSATTKVGGKIALHFTPIKDFKLSAIASPNLTSSKTKTFQKSVPYNTMEDPNLVAGYLQDHMYTNLTEDRADAHSLTAQILANYTHAFGKHDLNVMLGYESYYYFHESVSAFSDRFELDSYPYLNSGNKDYVSNSGSAYENAYRSYFGRVMYNYDDRYLVQFNIRRDGSSRFHDDYRWGTFPSVSLGWVMSQEKFMRGINPDVLTFLKVRGSWGKLGNERIGNYPYISLMDFTNSLLYATEDATVPTYYKGAAQISYAIRDISWETTESFDIGIDARFLNNRLSFSGDWYYKRTKDMLLELEIPKYVGYSNPEQNAGRMRTHGIDLELAWNDRIGEVSYSIGVNFSDYLSKMGDLKGTEFTGDQVKMEGSYFNEWYGYIAEGLFQTQEEVDNSPVINSTTQVGDIKYRDISGPDGEPDGVISPEYDRVLLGNSQPRYLFGGNASVAWRGFDFSFAFQGVGKQKVRMTENMVQPFKNQWGSIPEIIDGKYWSVNNTEAQNAAAEFPRLTYTNKDSNNAMSTFWLFNGRYFRMKNMTLGYTLPQQITRKFFIERLRFYVSANDLFCLHGYPKGYDPERTTAQYPLTTQILFGLNVNF